MNLKFKFNGKVIDGSIFIKPIIISIFIGTLFVMFINALAHSEIGNSKYEYIGKLSIECPEAKDKLLEYINNDDMISEMEYTKIRTLCTRSGLKRRLLAPDNI